MQKKVSAYIGLLLSLFMVGFPAIAAEKNAKSSPEKKSPIVNMASRDLIKIPLNDFNLDSGSQTYSEEADSLAGNFSFEFGTDTTAQQKDTDKDGLSAIVELALGTDPNKKSTNNNGYDDKTNLLHGYNPIRPGHHKLVYDKKLIAKTKGKMVHVETKIGSTQWFIYKNGTLDYLGNNQTEIGNSLKRLGISSDGTPLPKLVCSGKLSSDDEAKCFARDFKACRPSKELSYLNQQYSVLGPGKNGLCSLKVTEIQQQAGQFIEISTSTDEVGTSMVCDADNKKSFFQSFDWSHCSGPLHDIQVSKGEVHENPLCKLSTSNDTKYQDKKGTLSVTNNHGAPDAVTWQSLDESIATVESPAQGLSTTIDYMKNENPKIKAIDTSVGNDCFVIFSSEPSKAKLSYEESTNTIPHDYQFTELAHGTYPGKQYGGSFDSIKVINDEAEFEKFWNMVYKDASTPTIPSIDFEKESVIVSTDDFVFKDYYMKFNEIKGAQGKVKVSGSITTLESGCPTSSFRTDHHSSFTVAKTSKVLEAENGVFAGDAKVRDCH